MVTISHNAKSIQMELSDKINTQTDYTLKRITHTIELPKISCTSKEDAEYIQRLTNEFVSRLCHERLKI